MKRLQKQRAELSKIILGWIPSKDGSAAQILGNTEERRQGKLVCSEQEITKNAATLKIVLVSCPGEEVLRSSQIDSAKAKFFLSGGKTTRTKVTNPKTILNSSVDKNYSFRDNCFP
jgi:hypothetical protein